MKNKAIQIANTATLKNFTVLSKNQLQVITGGDDPVTSRGTKTSVAT